MQRVVGRILVCCLLLASFAACSSGPAAPTGGLDGTWSGTLTDSASGSGTAQLVLTQTSAGVSGTFVIAFPDASRNRSGTAGGTLAASVLVLTLSPSAPLACSPGVTLSGTISATATIVGNRMTGTYSSFTCGGAIGGTIDVTRR
jgi:hypothetical protein